jgi:NADPH:quinone reductase-like Zn-dependent oxidoreductase
MTALDPTTRMRAVVQTRYGDADVLGTGLVDRPVVGAREVLVEVRAAGLDRGTWHLMAGLPYAVRPVSGFRAPRQPVPGRDLAGVVVAVGADVTRFSPGDEVFGTGSGTFAEFAAAPEDRLAAKPAGLSFVQAAAMPVSGGTALQALTDVGRLTAGQRVLVLGASGGVGTFAVQLAVALGAEVAGVCSPGKADLVRSLGAVRVLDHTRDDVADSTYDLVLDVGGNTPLSRLRRALTPTGTLVIVGGEGGGRWLGGTDRQLRALALSPFVRQRLTTLLATESSAVFERLAAFVDDGRLTPVVERTFSLAEAPGAMRHLVGGHARGKLVIVP